MILPRELLERVPREALDVCRTLEDAGHRAYLVGGAIRDLLLGAGGDPDWDVATSARPDEVMALFRRTVPTGVDHGTVTVVMPGASYEVTTFRGESTYSDGRHPDGVTFLPDIEGDLARRDFTVNAMALDPRDGTLLDPHGGRRAIERRVLEAVGDPLERFREDGLRPMRAARFVAVLELAPDEGLVPAMRAAREVFARVSAERKRDEIVKMMAGRRPSAGWRMLESAGYLPLIFPGLEATVGCMQGGRHDHDVWTHSLLSTDLAPVDPLLRIAALLHDAGKPGTAEPREEAAGGMHFFRHEQVGEEMVRTWLRELRFSRQETDRAAHLVRHHMVIYRPEWSDAAVRRFVARIGREHLDDVIDLAIADVRAQGRSDFLVPLAEELRARARAEIDGGSALDRSDLAVSGSDVIAHLGIAPGPEVGRLLVALLERVVEDPSLNERDALLDLASRLHAGEE